MSKTETLDEVTRAEAEAAEAAQKAQAAAERARVRAEQAKAAAEVARERRMREYLDKLQREWPQAREQAATALGEARQALETAVRAGDDVFRAYTAWVQASIDAWAVDAALAQMRDFCGQHTRETPVPAFNFTVDVAAIVDRFSMELQDVALDEIRERRRRFLAGEES